MEQVLRDAYHADSIDFTTRLTESVLARLHFEVRTQRGAVVPKVDLPALESALANATRFWEDDLAEALIEAERRGDDYSLQIWHRNWITGLAATAEHACVQNNCAGSITVLLSSHYRHV